MRIGHNILRRRNELGWNQETLGKKVGKGQPEISRIESNLSDITLDELDAFAEALQTTREGLLSGSNFTVHIDSQNGGQIGNYNTTNNHITPEDFMNELRAEIRANDSEIQFYRAAFQQMMEQLRESSQRADLLIEQIQKLVGKLTG